jgi:hypothetical protein
MVVFSIGLPSRFAEWCDALVHALVETSLGSVEAVALNTLEELASAVIRNPAQNLVVCCRQPGGRLQSEIFEAGRPFVVALGDPRAALRNLIQHGYTTADALRALASSCATMLAITRGQHALVVVPRDAADPSRVVSAVAEHLQLPLAERSAGALLARLPVRDPTQDETESDSWWEELSERDRTIIGGALGPYIEYFAGGDLDRMVWEPELFFAPAASGPSLPVPSDGVIDITGRARCLVFGPFVALPPGRWLVDLVLGFSAETAGVGFDVEVFTGSQLAHTRIEPSGEQVVETHLYFTIADDSDQPVQIRVHDDRAAFDGRLALGHVAIVPQAALPEEIRERLVNILRR